MPEQPSGRPLSALQWLIGILDAVGSQPRGARLRQCPAHADSAPSLSVRAMPEGRVAVKCHAGCGYRDILRSLKLDRLPQDGDLLAPPTDYARRVGLALEFPPVELRHGHPLARGFRLDAVHDYGRAVLFRYRSGQHKEFQWETRMPNGRLMPGLRGITLADLPLYRETEVRQGIALGEPVLLVESESSVDALRGWHATTWAGSATTINIPRLREVLGDYPHVVMIPDRDDKGAGMRCCEQLRAAGVVKHVLTPAPGEDARDLRERLGPVGFARAVAVVLADARRLGEAA